jgi:hypothetical protein
MIRLAAYPAATSTAWVIASTDASPAPPRSRLAALVDRPEQRRQWAAVKLAPCAIRRTSTFLYSGIENTWCRAGRRAGRCRRMRRMLVQRGFDRPAQPLAGHYGDVRERAPLMCSGEPSVTR